MRSRHDFRDPSRDKMGMATIVVMKVMLYKLYRKHKTAGLASFLLRLTAW